MCLLRVSLHKHGVSDDIGYHHVVNMYSCACPARGAVYQFKSYYGPVNQLGSTTALLCCLACSIRVYICAAKLDARGGVLGGTDLGRMLGEEECMKDG
jgi:hypothetical protein